MTGGKAPAQAGTRFERRVRTLLENDGYFVIRTPGSRSAADLVAVKAGQVLFVQCKVNGRLDPEPWNILYDLCDTYGVVPVMAERPYPGCVHYWRLTGRKNGSRVQPMEKFAIDEVISGD